MKTRNLIYIFPFLMTLAFVFSGCSDSTKPDVLDPTLDVTPVEVPFGEEGAREEIVITTNQARWFSVMSEEDKSWCFLTENDDRLGIRVSTNTLEKERQTTIQIIVAGSLSRSIVVKQAAASPIPSLAVSSAPSFAADATTPATAQSVTITTNQASWNASVDETNRNWCLISENHTDNTITINVLDNPGNERIAVVTVVAGEAPPVSFQVLQADREEKEAIEFNVPDFSASFVYAIMHEGVKIAEVCSEFLPEYSLTERAVVAYPVNNGEVDLTRGYVVNTGGSVSWDKTANTYTYVAGTTSPVTTLYVSGGMVLGYGIKTGEATSSPERFTDAENNTYKLTKIGVQYWMAENLKSLTYVDKTPVSPWSEQGKGCYLIYSDRVIQADRDIRGCLYDIYALDKLTPAGWHVPGSKEWDKLNRFLEKALEGDASIKTGDVLMNNSGWGDFEAGSNVTGFSAIPGGSCWPTGKTQGGDEYANWWSISGTDKEEYMSLNGVAKMFQKGDYGKKYGYSVRFLKD